MTFACLRNKAYDWIKCHRPFAWAFFGSARYQHFGPITREGEVVGCYHNCADGDYTFDLKVDDQEAWHVEATSCYPAIQDIVRTLHIGDRVRVSGIKTFDPNHHILWKHFRGGGGIGWEIHPVTSIQILA